MQGHPNDNDNSSVRDAFLILILLASFLFVSSIEGDYEPRQLTKPEVVNYDETRGRKQNTDNVKHAIDFEFSGLFTNDWRLRTMNEDDMKYHECWYVQVYTEGDECRKRGGSIQDSPYGWDELHKLSAFKAGYDEGFTQ